MRIRQHTNPLLAAYDHFRDRQGGVDVPLEPFAVEQHNFDEAEVHDVVVAVVDENTTNSSGISPTLGKAPEYIVITC